MASFRVGIDVGGTFTDVVAIKEDTGESFIAKDFTTPEDASMGVMLVLEESGIPICDIITIGHGFTTGINAIITRKGARTALLCTKGHRDLLDFGRQYRPLGKELYDPSWVRPHQERPLISREHRRGITGRILWDGSELVSLDEEQIRQEVRWLKQEGIESIGICFINSFINLEHEKTARQIIREIFPEAYTQTSEIYPIARETERTFTVSIDAYIGPIVGRYLELLERKLSEAGYQGEILIMQLNGGFRISRSAREMPVYSVQSGPVSGVAGGELYSKLLDSPNLITFSMGGTSTDVGVIRAGKAIRTDRWDIEHGIILSMPMVEVHSIGSGGGSIVDIDKTGSLRIGPDSAGASPGPACYGFGGVQPTLTDAYLIMGILQPDLFLGGRLKLKKELAEKALKRVSDPLKMDLFDLARGAYDLASTQMAEAVKTLTINRGLDPRDFGLLSYGAAGPMHATAVAKALSIPTVFIPIHPGAFCCLGLAAMDMKTSYMGSFMKLMDEVGPDGMNKIFQELEQKAIKDLEKQGVTKEHITTERTFFGMYKGQGWDTPTTAPSLIYDCKSFDDLKEAFHQAYYSTFAYMARELPIILTSAMVTATGKLPGLRLAEIGSGCETVPRDALITTRDVFLGYRSKRIIPFYERSKLLAGNRIIGPAIIIEAFATTVLHEGDSCTVDKHGTLAIRV